MKILFTYISVFSGLSLFIILIFDSSIMPFYVREGTGRYMVNVIDKKLNYAELEMR